MTKTTIKPETQSAPDTVSVAPPLAPTNGHVPKSLNDPLIPNHPLAPLAGAFNGEPLWNDLQKEIREYRQRMNEQSDEDD